MDDMETTTMNIQSSSHVSETMSAHSGIPEYPPIEIPPAPQSVASFDACGSRLMITNIVNENFKSYAGIQTLGPFHKSFSSIVGPNGSGKSNVIDSMLFVFGYRANKIRSKKISVLIHKSENHKNIQSCTVSVHFQKIIDKENGDDDFEVVPDSKFRVSRTAFSDNSSYYKINDKKSTFKEVATLLRASGIDLDHNRFLILQGEVEQIAMMKPKALTEHEFGMLEFLEDIIGSSRFKEPIDLLSKRVEDLNEIRGEKLNRVKAVEKEKDDLEDVKNEALEYLKLENDIVKKKNVLYQKYIEEFTEQEKKTIQKKDEIKDTMKDVDAKLAEINEHKKEKTRESKNIYKSYETLSKASEQTKEAFAKFEQQDVRCREDLKHAKAKKKKLEKTLEQERNKLEELKMIPEKSEKDVEDLKKKLQNLNTEMEKEEMKLAEVMESLKTETQGLQAEKEDKEKELVELEKIENEAKSKYQVTKSEHELYLKNQNAENSKLVDSQKHYENCLSTLKDRRNAIKDLNKRIPEVESAIQKNQKDNVEATNVEVKIAEEIKNTRMKVEEAKNSLNSARSQGTVLKSLMDLKRSGRLPGVYGRLGDLGAIEEKYDVAISTACGSLDNIVTDTMDCAQHCVEFLKKNSVGTATFIGMDKMDKWKPYCKKKISTPENVPRLFDLVNVKEAAIQPAFYYALRDTLVAKDLDQATRIAYGQTRYRVVTLAGQLIDLSGTMSGGGNRVSKGRMSSSVVSEVDPKQVEEWEQKLASDTKQAQNCRENRQKLEESIHKMEHSLSEMKHTFEKYSLEIESLGEQEGRLLQQIEEQKQRVVDAAPDKKQLTALEKTVESHKKEYEKAGKAASAKQAEVQEIHRQIMVIGGTKMKSAQSRVNSVQSQIDLVTGNITKANVGIKTAHRNAQKTGEKVKNIGAEIEETQETLLKLDEEFKQLEKEAVSVMQEHKQATEKMKEAEAAMEECKGEITKLEEKENKMNSEHIEVKHELEKYENWAKDHQNKVKYWKKELNRLELHQIEGEETTALQKGTAEELAACKDIEYEITVLEEKLRQMKPNMAAIAEYRKKEELYLKRVAELDQITELRDAQRKQHEDLRKQRLDEFMDGFTIITSKLKEMYQMITLGGDAELELVDSLDPFSEGIVFSVRPPKKSWKNISNLSGGEKTLSSLALVFALHHYKPTPLYVMDEIDAALDFKNVSIVANYIKERTKNAQFIIISLRNNMFELADRLIGIYKTYNSTKTVTLNPMKINLPIESIETA